MDDKIRVIKACKLNDRYIGNKIIQDFEPIGLVIDVIGRIPESYIKYEPNRIFDRRKYPELYNLFGKDHLPSEIEIKIFQQKLLNNKIIKFIPNDMKEYKEPFYKKILKFLKWILLLPFRIIDWLWS